MMVGSTMRGMSLESFDNMTPGQIVDFCIAYNNVLYEEETGEGIIGQEFFDNF